MNSLSSESSSTRGADPEDSGCKQVSGEAGIEPWQVPLEPGPAGYGGGADSYDIDVDFAREELRVARQVSHCITDELISTRWHVKRASLSSDGLEVTLPGMYVSQPSSAREDPESEIAGILKFCVKMPVPMRTGAGRSRERTVITHLWVAPAWRGRGVARLLVAQLHKDSATIEVERHLSEAGARFFGVRWNGSRYNPSLEPR